MKRWFLLPILAILFLSGCASAEGRANDLIASVVQLPDGHSVICVTNRQTDSGGIDCDWEHKQ